MDEELMDQFLNVSITTLNDDCLGYVFEHLTHQEQFGIARVCKRWLRSVIERTEEIEIGDFWDDRNLFNSGHLLERDDRMFGGHHFGNVSKVEISNVELSPGHFVWLFECLGKLSVLHLSNVVLGSDIEADWNDLSEMFVNLKQLNVKYANGDWKNFTKSILTNATQLEEISWSQENSEFLRELLLMDLFSQSIDRISFDYFTIDDVILSSKNPSIKHISIDIVEFSADQLFDRRLRFNLTADFFAHFQHFTSLKSLKLGFETESNARLNQTTQLSLQFENLEKLAINTFRIAPEEFEKLLALFPNLETLKLSEFEMFCKCQANSVRVVSEEGILLWEPKNCCQNCLVNITKKLSDLENLKVLSLFAVKKIRNVSEQTHVIAKCLMLISWKRFEKLQRLAIDHTPSTVQLFEAFRRKAVLNKQKSFHVAFGLNSFLCYYDFAITVRTQRDLEEKFSDGKPRNLDYKLMIGSPDLYEESR